MEGGKAKRALSVNTFLDSGASGDFISIDCAKSLVDIGFKLEKLDRIRSVGSVDHNHCLTVHNLIKFNLIITDD